MKVKAFVILLKYAGYTIKTLGCYVKLPLLCLLHHLNVNLLSVNRLIKNELRSTVGQKSIKSYDDDDDDDNDNARRAWHGYRLGY